jgi:DNA-damage-inducible protein D
MIAGTKISLFKGRQIRKTLFQGERYFSVVDVIAALTDSAKPNVYWSAMKARVRNEDGFQLSTFCKHLKLEATDGKKYETDYADTEGIFRLIQSIPSPKAEPFKRWLAKVG